nr:MAG TPA: hypothetical protein [Caudoviricetes sp.]
MIFTFWLTHAFVVIKMKLQCRNIFHLSRKSRG